MLEESVFSNLIKHISLGKRAHRLVTRLLPSWKFLSLAIFFKITSTVYIRLFPAIVLLLTIIIAVYPDTATILLVKVSASAQLWKG